MQETWLCDGDRMKLYAWMFQEQKWELQPYFIYYIQCWYY